MKTHLLLIFIGMAASGLTNGQGTLSLPLRFCPAGLQPDAYLDWQKLPPPPPPNPPSVVPLNAVIPVSGVTGLNVTVQIPGVPISSPRFLFLTYGIDSSLDLEVAANNTVTLIFDKPVKGVSAWIGTSGRLQRSATMSAYRSPTSIGAASPADAEVTTAALDSPSPGDLATVPLQIRSEAMNIEAVTIQFNGSNFEYGSFVLRNVRVETGSAPDPANSVPKNGLRQWLRADNVYNPYRGPVNTWPDASANGADATPIPGSAFLTPPDGPYCSPVVQFNGSSAMTANLPIDGGTEMTIFMVASAEQDVIAPGAKDALSWGEAAPNGVTFLTPSQTHVFFRFGTTQANNQPVYLRPNSIAGDYSVTTAMHRDSVDYLWVNGLPVLKQGGKLARLSGSTSIESIGMGPSGSFFTGNIGEILIYDRALTDTERDEVEHYLMKKFGIF